MILFLPPQDWDDGCVPLDLDSVVRGDRTQGSVCDRQTLCPLSIAWCSVSTLHRSLQRNSSHRAQLTEIQKPHKNGGTPTSPIHTHQLLHPQMGIMSPSLCSLKPLRSQSMHHRVWLDLSFKFLRQGLTSYVAQAAQELEVICLPQ